MSYATLDEIYALGLSASAFVVRARPFDDVDAATATVRLKAHGFSALDTVVFEVTDGGVLPTGVSAFVAYTAIPVTADLFNVSLNGTPITSWVSGGSGWAIAVDPVRRILMHAAQSTAEIDEALTADQPPLLVDPITGKYPQQIIGLCARMAARAAVNSLDMENAAYRTAIDRLFAREATDNAQLAIWRSGKPLNPRPLDQNAIPDNGAIASSDTPTNWRSGTL